MEHFAIVGYARTGSTWLSSSLSSHPNIASGGEIFNDTNKFWRNWEQSPKLYLDYIREIGKEKGNINELTEFCGFKLLYYHAKELGDFFPVLENTKIIHLKRRRHLMSFTSKLLVQNSQKLKIRHPYQAQYKNQDIVIESPDKLFDHFKNREHTWKHFDNLFKKHEVLEVWYEDMCFDVEKEHTRILEFLGAEQMPLSSGTKKQRDKLLRESLKIYVEASQYLIKAL